MGQRDRSGRERIQVWERETERDKDGRETGVCERERERGRETGVREKERDRDGREKDRTRGRGGRERERQT